MSDPVSLMRRHATRPAVPGLISGSAGGGQRVARTPGEIRFDSNILVAPDGPKDDPNARSMTFVDLQGQESAPLQPGGGSGRNSSDDIGAVRPAKERHR